MLKEDSGWVNYNSTQEYVKELLNYVSGGDAIDVGCYTGRNTFFLAENGFSVTAIDNDQEYIKELVEKSKAKNISIDAKVLDVIDMPEDKQYDLVLCTMVMHFLDAKDIKKGFEKLKAITKPGGINLVSVLLKKDASLPRPHLFDPDELRTHYSEWQELDYLESFGPKYQENESSPIVRAPRAIVIARKISE